MANIHIKELTQDEIAEKKVRIEAAVKRLIATINRKARAQNKLNDLLNGDHFEGFEAVSDDLNFELKLAQESIHAAQDFVITAAAAYIKGLDIINATEAYVKAPADFNLGIQLTAAIEKALK